MALRALALPFLVTAAMVLAGLSAQMLLSRRRRLARLCAALGVEETPSHPLLDLLARLGNRIPGTGQALRELLLQAGYMQPAAPAVFAAARLGATAAAIILMLPYAHGLAPSRLLVALFAVFFVHRLSLILLKLKAEARQRAIRREMPPVVDVLLMVLNSGVSIDQCLHHAVAMLEQTAPLTGQVLRRYAADVDGGLPYDAAFERMGQRLGIDEGYDLASLIRQSLMQGGDIMAPLERFGAEIADKRVATAREQIGRKSVLLTLVMLAFFMPVLLIALGGPAASNVMETLHSAERNLHNRGARP